MTGIEKEPALIFLLFNQMQRYNIAHADPQVAAKLNEFAASPSFEEDIKKALTSNSNKTGPFLFQFTQEKRDRRNNVQRGVNRLSHYFRRDEFLFPLMRGKGSEREP